MNKIILIILLFIPIGVMASVWPANVPIALEFENNVVNTGYNSVTATNIGAFTFTGVSPKYGSYTLGSQPTPQTSKRVTVGSITETVKTLSVWINMPATSANVQQTYWSYQGDLPMLYHNGTSTTNTVVYLFNTTPFWQIGPYIISLGAWHNFVTTFDGTNVKQYIDGVLRGTQVSNIQPVSKYLVTGNRATTNTWGVQAQFDNMVVSLNDTGGAEIVVASPTNTVTNTATNTVTDTGTNTVTDTVTDTVTNTYTNTFTNTVTNTFTNTVTDTVTDTVTNTVTDTYTVTDTVTNTVTNTVTETYTQTVTNTVTETVTNTVTNTYTVTVTPTATPTPTPATGPLITPWGINLGQRPLQDIDMAIKRFLDPMFKTWK